MGFADRFSKKGSGGTSGTSGTTDSTDTTASDETTATTPSDAVAGGFSNKFSSEKKEASGSFTDNFQKKTQPKSYTEKVTRRSDLVYLVHGKDRDRDAWHYVLVDKNKLPLFLKQIETGSIDVALYGDVLRSGWGKNPPPEVVKEIEDEFGG
jgi:hypothetical protein